MGPSTISDISTLKNWSDDLRKIYPYFLKKNCTSGPAVISCLDASVLTMLIKLNESDQYCQFVVFKFCESSGFI